MAVRLPGGTEVDLLGAPDERDWVIVWPTEWSYDKIGVAYRQPVVFTRFTSLLAAVGEALSKWWRGWEVPDWRDTVRTLLRRAIDGEQEAHKEEDYG